GRGRYPLWRGTDAGGGVDPAGERLPRRGGNGPAQKLRPAPRPVGHGPRGRLAGAGGRPRPRRPVPGLGRADVPRSVARVAAGVHRPDAARGGPRRRSGGRAARWGGGRRSREYRPGRRRSPPGVRIDPSGAGRATGGRIITTQPGPRLATLRRSVLTLLRSVANHHAWVNDGTDSA